MDFSESAQLIAQTIELNPGAMYAHARVGSGSRTDLIEFAPAIVCALKKPESNKRATPRKIPGVSNTNERGFLKSDRELLGGQKKPGSLVAREMMGQLRHDFEPDKDGKPAFAQRVHEGYYWVAYSYGFWRQQFDLTLGEARAGVACMVDSGCVVTGLFEFGFQPEYLHFRLTEKALGYVLAKPDGVCSSSKGVCSSSKGYVPHNKPKTPTVSPTVLDSKPVDEKPSTVSPESLMPTGKTSQKQNQPLTAFKKVRKFSKLGKVFDETLAKNYPTNLQPPKGQKDFAYANLSHVKDRMQAARYSYEAVTRFVEYMAGDGWGIVRAQWTPEFNPQIGAKEKAPAHPDLGWLVGSEKHGTGMHRLEIALDVWHMDGEPRPGETPAEPQEQPATPMANVTHAVDASPPVAPAVAPEPQPQPVDPRLSVTDAWEMVERASSLTPMIEMWRASVADGVFMPALEKYMKVGEYQGPTAEYLEIALALMPPVSPTPEPPLPVQCPAIAPVVQVTAPYEDEVPLSQEQMLKNLAVWLPKATAQHQAALTAKKAEEAKHHYVA